MTEFETRYGQCGAMSQRLLYRIWVAPYAAKGHSGYDLRTVTIWIEVIVVPS